MGTSPMAMVQTPWGRRSQAFSRPLVAVTPKIGVPMVEENDGEAGAVLIDPGWGELLDSSRRALRR